ncbi:hypothetical protein PAXRUDRAFT_18118, partial [Paxillus rubicundulus Ve08.2h10]
MSPRPRPRRSHATPLSSSDVAMRGRGPWRCRDSPTSTDIHYGEAFASPLLMAVLEQVVAKVSKKLMTPSDTLAVYTFVRQLLIRLASKQRDEGYGGLHSMLDKLETSASGGQPFPDHLASYRLRGRVFDTLETMTVATRAKDVATRLWWTFYVALNRYLSASLFCETLADTFFELATIFTSNAYTAASDAARLAGAFELVDWVRLTGVNPSPSGISRIAFVIRAFYEPALW